MTRRWIALAGFAALTALGLSGEALALSVAPMQVELISAGMRSHSSVAVINNSDAPMPIEAVVQKMTLDESGKATTTKTNGEDFLIVPPQAIIPPGATQNFRIQWLGEPKLEASESYYVFFNQVPVKMPAGKAGVQVVMSFGVMVNVAPPGGPATLQVAATGVTTDAKGHIHPTLTVDNPGRVHALLPNFNVRVATGSFAQTPPSGLIAEKIGSGLVQPGKRRKFVLPVELPPGASHVEVTLEPQPAHR